MFLTKLFHQLNQNSLNKRRTNENKSKNSKKKLKRLLVETIIFNRFFSRRTLNHCTSFEEL